MGCRVLKVAPGFVEGMLTKGIDAWDPIDVPNDLEIVSARMNVAHHPVIELLVKSEEFKGDDSATFETAPAWSATFRRKAASPAPGGKDVRRGP